MARRERVARATPFPAWKLLRIADFSKGLNTTVHPRLLDPAEAQILENVELDEKGTLRPATGYVKRYAAAFDASPVAGMAQLIRPDGTTRLVAAAGTTLYKDAPHVINRYDSQAEWETGQRIGLLTAVSPGNLKLPSAAPAGVFARSSVAYKSDGLPVISGAARFEAAKFADGLFIEESTQNLLTANQASVEKDTTGFHAVGGTAISRDTTEAWHGAASLKVVTPGTAAGEGASTDRQAATAGQAYAATVHIKGSGNLTVRLLFTDDPGSVTGSATANITAGASWSEVEVAGTAPPGTTHMQIQVFTRTDLAAQAVTCFVDGLQLEQKAYATSFQLPSPNLLSDNQASWETKTTGTTFTGGTGSIDATEFFAGAKSLKFVTSGVVEEHRVNISYIGSIFKVGAQYTASVYVKGPSGQNVMLRFDDNTGVTEGAATPMDGTWKRVSVTRTMQNAVSQAPLLIFCSGENQTYFLDACQIEPHASATDFQLPSAKTTRAAELAYWTMDQALPQNFMVGFWFKPDFASTVGRTGTIPILLGLHKATPSANDRVDFAYDTSTDTFEFTKKVGGATHKLSSAAIAFAQGDLIGVVLRQTAGGMKLSYKIGSNAIVHVSNAETTAFATDLVRLYLGYPLASGYEANAALDGILVKAGEYDDAAAEAYLGAASAPTWDPDTLFLYQADSSLSAEKSAGGRWISPTIDASTATDKASGLAVETATIPAGASLTVHSRSSADGSTWGAWVARNADNSLAHSANNYVQVRLTLERTDLATDPAVHNLTVSFDSQPSMAILETGLAAGAQYHFTQGLGYLSIANKLNDLRKWDGLTQTPQLVGGSPPKLQYVAFHKNYVFGAGTSANPNRLYWCELLDLDNWPVLNFIDIAPDDGDHITFLFPTQDYLVIGKERSVWVLTGDSADTFAVRRILASAGALAPRSVALVQGLLTFANADGVTATDFVEQRTATERLVPTWNALNARKINGVASHFWRHKLVIAVPDGTNQVNSAGVVFDALRNAWGKYTPFGFSCFTPFREAGKDILLAGSASEGQVYELFQGANFAGAAIAMRYRSPEFGFGAPERIKRFRRCWLEIKGGVSATTVYVAFQVDGGSLSSDVALSIPAGEVVRTYQVLMPQVGITQGHALAVQIRHQTVDVSISVQSIALEYLERAARAS